MRRCCARPARRPAPPPPARLHDRRALARSRARSGTRIAAPAARSDRRPPITPQLALRVAILGGIALVLFAIIFFRLWFLQVLSGDKYLAEAQQQPRARRRGAGAARRRSSTATATCSSTTASSIAVQVEPDRKLARRAGAARARNELASTAALPRAVLERARGYAVIGMRREDQRRVMQQLLPYAPHASRPTCSQPIRFYLLERQDPLPRREVERIYLRKYPHTTIGRALFGTVGGSARASSSSSRYRGVQQGTIVGQDGHRVHLRPLPARPRRRQPHPGRRARAARRASCSRATRGRASSSSCRSTSASRGRPEALQQAIARRRGNAGRASSRWTRATARSSRMGSTPTLRPEHLRQAAHAVALQRDLDAETTARRWSTARSPALYPDRVDVQADHRDRGARGRADHARTRHRRRGLAPDRRRSTFHNAGGAANGAVALRNALQVSSDVFFYTLGPRRQRGQGRRSRVGAQASASASRTGIDLPGEFGGLIPPRLAPRVAQTESLYPARHTAHPTRPWSVGDNVNLAVGQGDLQATPLQMAVAYAAIANGGTRRAPARRPRGRGRGRRACCRRSSPAAPQASTSTRPTARRSSTGCTPPRSARRHLRRRLRAASRIPVDGKTGTAERGDQADQSWYVVLRAGPERADRRGGDRRAGRLRRRGGRARPRA